MEVTRRSFLRILGSAAVIPFIPKTITAVTAAARFEHPSIVAMELAIQAQRELNDLRMAHLRNLTGWWSREMNRQFTNHLQTMGYLQQDTVSTQVVRIPRPS